MIIVNCSNGGGVLRQNIQRVVYARDGDYDQHRRLRTNGARWKMSNAKRRLLGWRDQVRGTPVRWTT